MLKHLKAIVIALALVIIESGIAIPVLASASNEDSVNQVQEAAEIQTDQEEAEVEVISSVEVNEKGSKALSAAAVVGIAAAAGAISMGIAISKAVESIARQPEAGGRIQTMLMLGLVFIETAIIYALIVAILIIFVL